MWWILGAGSNAVIAVAYLMIVLIIARPLVANRELKSNALGAATAAIFFTCAIHHGAHVVHMLMPFIGVDVDRGSAMQVAWSPELALWDVVGAVVALFYWSLRTRLGTVDGDPQLFKNQHEREQRAMELNDSVLQGMVVAQLALELGQRERGVEALSDSIAAASEIITGLIADHQGHLSGSALRSSAAVLEHEPKPRPDVPRGSE